MIVKTDCETDGTLHSTNFNTVPGPRLSVIIVWSGSCPLDVSMCGGAGAALEAALVSTGRTFTGVASPVTSSSPGPEVTLLTTTRGT